MNLRGAELARQAVDEAGRAVRGRLGRPAQRHLVAVPEVDNPAHRAVSTTRCTRPTRSRSQALAEGGVDLLLIETIFDTLNAKAAIEAARDVAAHLPLWISVTIVDLSGRTLSGQTVEAFWGSVEHAEPAAGRRQLLAGRGGDPPAHRRAGPARRHLHGLPSQRGPAERVRRLRPDAGGDRVVAEGVRRAGHGEHRRRLLRHHPGAHRAHRRRGPHLNGPRRAPVTG